ncbi:MAG: excinuclease ABC subunit UvrC [Planctomycetes bacterium]|nr:excinuclease ABC subunit UvrC [Planctomycetota bacterium]
MDPASRPGVARKLEDIPDCPGVYLMKDGKGRVLYIGKAKSLRHRVRSYFAPSADHEAKTAAMVEKVQDIEWFETASEVDALLLESRLIKGIQPRYNINLRDAKSYPYLCVTRGEDFPLVFIARESEFDRSRASAFGPFTDVAGLRRALKLLQRVFRFRTCTLDIREDDPKRRFFRPCILYQIDQCLAPCGLYTDKRTYRDNIESLKRFLRGKRTQVVGVLARRMKEASARLDFEEAARLRDQLHGIESLDKMGAFGDFLPGNLLHVDPMVGVEELARALLLDKIPRHIVGIDIANLKEDEPTGSVVTFVDGVPFKDGYRHFKIKTGRRPDDYAMMREVVRRHFRRVAAEVETAPDLVLLDGGRSHLASVLAEFSEIGTSPPPLLALAKKKEEIFLPGRDEPLVLDTRSKALHLLQQIRDEAHRFARRLHHLRRGRSALAEKGGRSGRGRKRSSTD